MPATKIVLHCPIADTSLLPGLVEAWISSNIELIAVHGDGCEAIHDLIDELIVGDGNAEDRFITTTWHGSEPIENVVEFAETFGNEGAIEHVKP